MLKHKISLLVCSNRPEQKFNKIWTKIIDQKILDQVFLATQGEASNYQNEEKKVKHLKLDSKGRSKAINSALGDISSFAVALTDDDCFLDKDFLTEAKSALNKKNVALVYGQTKAFRPFLHPGKFCPSTFKKETNEFSTTTKLGKHWLDVGFDNNAVIKKEVFDNIGFYKSWMGPGCLVPAAEDGEFILRSLIAGYKIAYNPKMIVKHNRFLNKKEKEEQLDLYTYGGLVAYGFYAMQGVKELRQIYREHLSYFYYRAKDHLRSFLKNGSSKDDLKNFFYNFNFLLKGVLIAFTFAKVIPIPEKENVVKRFYKNKQK